MARRGVSGLLLSGVKTELQTPGAWVVPLGDFLTWLRASNRPDSTIYLRSYQLRRFAIDVGVDPFDATTDLLVDYIAGKGRPNIREWSNNTRRGMRNALRSFYGWAYNSGRMSFNPAALTPPAPADIGHARPADQFSITFGLAGADERERLMIELGHKMGLRCIEISRVHVGRDLHQDLFGDWLLHVHGKGRRERDVDVPPDVLVLLRKAGDGWAFPGRIDGHLSSGYISKLLSRALPEGVTAHMLRHTAATKVHEASGGDIRVTQEFLGHSSPMTTQIYTHVKRSKLRDAVLAAAAA